MYGKEIKSETALARAVHLLTLGAYAWDECHFGNPGVKNWRELGGGDIGSVFHNQESAPDACDWVKMALLEEPAIVMNSEWYRGKENLLALLKKIAFEGANHSGFLGGVDQSLRSGARWLCDFAGRFAVGAAALASKGSCASGEDVPSKEAELERRKKAAKEKAMAMMKAQMAKFAANIPGFDDDDNDHMSEDTENRSSRASSPNFSTPVRNRSDSFGTEAMDLSPSGDFLLTCPDASEPPTPRSPQSGCSTPRTTSQHSGIRLLNERPQCIVCGNDSDPMQLDDSLGDTEGKQPAKASSDVETNREKALAFCGYAQASTVTMGGDGVRSQVPCTDTHVQRHVGVHLTLCGHAIHKTCADSYLRTVSQRDDRLSDRLEGGKRREFRCPLCQRLQNTLIPFIDVGADWVDSPTSEDAPRMPVVFKSEDESVSHDVMNSNETIVEENPKSHRLSLHDFLSTSKWWVRNDKSLAWDGQCLFFDKSDEAKPMADSPSMSPRRQSLRKIQAKFGKKELISAWNAVLKTPRLVKRRARTSSTDRNHAVATLELESTQKESNSVTDVLRRFMDQISDVAHRADLRRLGEDDLCEDYGEFRHYLNEKAAYNKVNRAAGKEMVEVRICGPSWIWQFVCNLIKLSLFHCRYIVAYVPISNIFDRDSSPGIVQGKANL